GEDNALSLTFRSQPRNCPTLKLPRGAEVNCSESADDCLSNVAPGTNVTFKCKEHHISSYAYSSVDMLCEGKKGTWKNNLPFSCSLQCGIFPPVPTTQEASLAFEKMSWNGLIASYSSLNESTSPTPLCSAVSIDSAFALTSAKC
ncbi:unnamed protein product, partial [Allacma fusca]